MVSSFQNHICTIKHTVGYLRCPWYRGAHNSGVWIVMFHGTHIRLTWSPMDTTRCFSTSVPPRQNQQGPLGWGGGRLFDGGGPSPSCRCCCLCCFLFADWMDLWSKKKFCSPPSSREPYLRDGHRECVNEIHFVNVDHALDMRFVQAWSRGVGLGHGQDWYYLLLAL